MRHRCGRRSLFVIAAGVLVAGLCGQAQPAEAPQAAKASVLLFAAASTTDAIEEIRGEFERQNAGVQVRISFAASSTLAKQIEAGAGADLFLSASVQWVDYLAKQDLVARRRDLLGNRLVIVVSAEAGVKIAEAKDLADDRVRRLALGDPESVPAGIYAREALTRLGLWDKLRGKVVSGADVRQALQFVESGAAEAGIVYATDVAIAKHVRVAATIDAKLTDPIRYPLALLTPGTKNAAVGKFFDFLTSDDAAKIFEKYGFIVLTPDAEKRQR